MNFLDGINTSCVSWLEIERDRLACLLDRSIYNNILEIIDIFYTIARCSHFFCLSIKSISYHISNLAKFNIVKYLLGLSVRPGKKKPFFCAFVFLPSYSSFDELENISASPSGGGISLCN